MPPLRPQILPFYRSQARDMGCRRWESRTRKRGDRSVAIARLSAPPEPDWWRRP